MKLLLYNKAVCRLSIFKMANKSVIFCPLLFAYSVMDVYNFDFVRILNLFYTVK